MWKRGGNKSRAWNRPQYCRIKVLITSLILILVVLMISLFHENGKPKWNSIETFVQFNPTVEFLNGAELIWQIPDTPKAVLFLAHRCGGRAVDFWDRSPNCPNCVGLPEERLLVLHALALKYSVLTISSTNRCWAIGDEMEEILIVKDIIKWWVEKNKLQKLPLVALGASSGGYFVSVLATKLKFSSITIMITEGRFNITENYPPTLFVHMSKDMERQKKIDVHLKLLKSKGVDVKEVKCMKFPLSPRFLAERIPGLDQAVSAKLFELFREKGIVDENGYVKNDECVTCWREALKKSEIRLPDTQLVQHIQEELNLASGDHEMTSLQSEQIFDWFESHMS